MSKPTTLIVIGMAGSGKSTFMQRLNSEVHRRQKNGYIINLDPAVHNVPYGANIDIRETVNYKEVMKQYNLGPNGGILTALNLFTTKFDQVLGFVEKRAAKLDYIMLDTPGQIEIFTWSASGSIITDSFASGYPTVICYVVDTPRCTSPATFMSNMLYACSILYKTKLPFVIVFNKTDVVSHDFCVRWMSDYEEFQEALQDDTTYMGSLVNSMSLVLEEFYHHLRVAGVSAVTGQGMDDFFKAVDAAVEEYHGEYRVEMERLSREREEKEKEKKQKMVEQLMKDMSIDKSKQEDHYVMYHRTQVFKDFLDRAAPPNYVAGLGRGAVGFTTASDIGPATEAAIEDPLEAGAAEKFADPDNETGLFSGLPYTADDEEADKIYESIDKKMAQRHKKAQTPQTEKQAGLSEQFADLKRNLATVSADEWANIPEVGNLTRKKRKVQERFGATPDTLISVAVNDKATSNTAVVEGEMDGMATDFRQFSQARDRVLGLKLDQVQHDSTAGQTTVDPKGYLTDLNSMTIKSAAEIGDIKKARTLLKSVTATNPKHAPGWIAAARLEEVANRIGVARELIRKGCEECPQSEDVWLEAARLNSDENARVILANASKYIPGSVKVWLRAMQLETEPRAKKRVLRKALEENPGSVKLWKALVSLEEDQEDAKILLSRAVECVPQSVDLWIALAKIETYENAKKVLNKARQSIPTSHEIWLNASKLEESQGNEKMVDAIVARAIKTLAAKGASLQREEWISQAEQCEKEQFVLTCQAIVRHTLGLGLDEMDYKVTWMDDADSCVTRKSIATARAIYAHTIQVFADQSDVWRRAAMLEKEHGSLESLQSLLRNAVTQCPHSEVLWLMSAKEQWLTGQDVPGARRILQEAFAANPDSEEIWLAAIKLEIETGEFERARVLLASARERADTAKVWMKNAVLERRLGHFQTALDLVSTAISKFPGYAKLWMIKGQIESQDIRNAAAARETYANAVKKCPKSSVLWILAAKLEEAEGFPVKARALLEKGRLINNKAADLWCEAIRLEMRAGHGPMAKTLLSKALQECPNSGLLWAEAILAEARPQRKARSADAIKKCENDAIVISTVARLFWSERKVEMARNWFNKAIKSNPDYGDAWAWLLKFELQHGDDSSVNEVISRCVSADPRHGELWQATKKDMRNLGKGTREILKLVASQCDNTLIA